MTNPKKHALSRARDISTHRQPPTKQRFDGQVPERRARAPTPRKRPRHCAASIPRSAELTAANKARKGKAGDPITEKNPK